jgi:hypothetical protein
MAYGPNIPPMSTSVPHGPIPDISFPRTPAYVTPNPRVEGEVKDGVRDQIARTLCHTRFLCQNQVLIICITQDQLFHTYGQKYSQITKCHE